MHASNAWRALSLIGVSGLLLSLGAAAGSLGLALEADLGTGSLDAELATSPEEGQVTAEAEVSSDTGPSVTASVKAETPQVETDVQGTAGIGEAAGGAAGEGAAGEGAAGEGVAAEVEADIQGVAEPVDMDAQVSGDLGGSDPPSEDPTREAGGEPGDEPGGQGPTGHGPPGSGDRPPAGSQRVLVDQHTAPLGTPAHVDPGQVGQGQGSATEEAEESQERARLPATGAAVLPATATLAGAAGYWLLRFRHLGVFWLVPLYSKLSREELLENRTRQDLLDLVRRRPGLCVKTIMEEVSHAWGATIYHLDRLERAGFLFHRRQGRHRRYYAAGGESEADLEAMGMLREGTPSKLAWYLLDHPGAIQKEVAEALDLAAPTVHKHTKRLMGAGLVTKVPDGRTVRYHPTPRLARLEAKLEDEEPAVPVPA